MPDPHWQLPGGSANFCGGESWSVSAFLLLLIQYCNFYIIAYQRLLIILAEDSLGFTFVKYLPSSPYT